MLFEAFFFFYLVIEITWNIDCISMILCAAVAVFPWFFGESKQLNPIVEYIGLMFQCCFSFVSVPARNQNEQHDGISGESIWSGLKLMD